MNTFIFERSDTFRTRKTKRWFALLSFCFMLFMGQMGFAQTVIIGTGVNTNTNIPVYTYWGYNASQQIVTASELGNPGTKQITKIRWYVDGNADLMSSSDNWQVYLGNTTKTDFTSDTDWVLAGDMTQVFSGTVTAVNASWMEITLSSTFIYTGDNLVVAVSEVEPSYAGNFSSNTTFGSYTSANNTGIYIRNDTNPYNFTNSPGTGTRTNTLARLQIELSEPPSCFPPTGLTATNLTYGSADLGWISDGEQFDIKWGTPGFDVEEEGALEEDFVSGATLSGLDAETTYEFYVRQNCGEEMSDWAGPYSFYTGYCVPATTSGTSYGITGVSTSGGYTNISNLNSGFTSGGYSNQTVFSVSQSPGEQINYSVSVPSYTNLEIWIDLNQNLVFDTEELVANHAYSSSATTFNGVLDIPEELSIGEYRIRVRSRYYWNTTANPCGVVQGETEDYTLSVVAPPTCFPPADLTATGITHNSADLGWTSDGEQFDIKWGAPGFDVETEGTLEEGFVSGGTLSGLVSLTTYQFYVRNNCGGGDISDWAGPFGFTTLCAPEVAPTAVQSFSDFTTTAPNPACWSEATGDVTANSTLTGTTSKWAGGNFGNTGSNTSARINLYSSSSDWLISPQIDLGAIPGLFRVKYDMAVTSYSGTTAQSTLGSHIVRVIVSTDGGATWSVNNTVKTYTGVGSYSNTGQTETVNLTEYSGVVKIAFVATTASISPDVYFYVDNFTVENLPSCLEPSNLTATDITAAGADLGWTSDGTAFDIKWGMSGFDVETEGTLEEGFENGGTLSGLDANTTYAFYVRNNCGVDDLSVWAGPFSFTTLCEAVSALNENFDSTTTPNLPECWGKIFDNGANSFATITTTTTNSSSPNGVSLYNSDSSSSSNIILVSPVLSNLDAGTHWLRFSGRNSIASQDIVIGTLSDPTDGGTFTPFETVDLTTTFAEYTVDFSAYSGTDTYIGFRRLSTSTYTYVYLDDIVWEEKPSCMAPTDLTATPTSLTGADISWTASEPVPAEGYVYAVTTSPTAPESGTSVVGTSASVSDLISNTTYYLHVRANCGEEDYSDWVTTSFWLGYCIPTGAANNSDEIMNFTLNNLNNDSAASEGTAGYMDYSGTVAPAQLPAGVAAIASLTSGAGGGNHGAAIWIDYDQNGTFDDSEKVAWIGNTIGASATVSFPEFTVPAETTPGIYRLRVMYRYNVSGEAFVPCVAGSIYAEIEDYAVQVLPPPSCLPPSNLTISNLTYSSADLSWTSDGTAFDIKWGTPGFDVETEGTLEEGFENGATLSGLDAETTYEFYVRNNCGVDGLSDWTGPYSFYTGYCVPTGTSDNYRITGVSTSGGYTNITNPGNGTSNPYSNYTAMSVSQSPGESISYSVTVPAYSGGLRIWVDLNQDLIFDEDELVAIHTTYNVTTLTGDINIPEELPLGNYRIRIRSNYSSYTIPACGDAQYGYGEAEDYTLSVVAPPTCFPPADLTATNITINSVDLSWTSDGEQFDVLWGETGFDVEEEGTLEEDFENGGTLSGLAPQTTYHFYVRNNCGVDDLSDWAGPVSFTTPCLPTTVPYLQDFESVTVPALPDCTSIQNVGTGHNWDTNNTSGQGFTGKFLRYDYNTSNAANAWFYTQGIELEAGVEYVISYDYGNNSTSYTEKLKVAYGTSAANTAMTTQLADHPTINQGAKQYNEVVFSPASTGVYYFGFHAYSNSNQWTLRLDNIHITEKGWTGEVNTAWENAANWRGGVPDASADVVIDSANPAVISTDITVNSITLGADASLTVASNTSLTTGDITVASGGSFVIENNANLFQTAGAVNTGDVAVKRNSSLIKHLDYTLWSSPVAEQGLKAFSPQTIWYRIYTYNTTSDQWGQVFGSSEAPDTDFEAGVGYMFRAPNNFVTTPYTYNGEFTGTPNNGNVTVNFDATNGTYQGIGNPYPSNIKIEGPNGFWDTNSGAGTLYFWTNVNPWDDNLGDYTGNNWATFSKVGGVGTAGEGDSAENDASDKTPTGIIPVGQGFVIESGSENSVTFTNDMRTSDAGVFFKMLDQDKGRLWLDLSEGSQELNQVLIGYVSGASQGYDFGYDSEMFGYVGSALYSLIGNNEVNYTIQGRALPFDDNDEVPLGFRANNGGSFTISLNNFDGLFIDENQDIFLKDNLTGEEHNLKNDAYSFVSEEGTFNSRFSIVYKEAGSLNVSTPDLNNNWVVFKQNEMFRIQTQGFDMSEVTVYDILGRVVYTSEAEGNNHMISRIDANQVLIVKVTTSDNQVLTKKVNN